MAERHVGGSPTPWLNFVHIPKTAGTSMRGMVEQFYPTDRVAPSSRIKKAMEAQGATRKTVEFGPDLAEMLLYCGHTNVTSILPESYRRFTVMREPVARLRSQFNHWVSWSRADIEGSPSNAAVKALKHSAKTSSLEEFLARDGSPIDRLFRNGQCKTLVSNFPEQYHNRLNGDHLVAMVRENLDAMLMVGVTERLDDSARVLCWMLGWPPPARVERLNARRRDRERDAGELPAIVEEAVALDREAYAHALARFERDHAAMLEDLGLASDAHEADLDGVIAALDARSKAALVASDAERSDAVHARMDGGIRGVGWHELEKTRTGHAYRWTGPGTTTTLDTLVQPADRYDVSVGVVSLLHRDVLKGARVRINGVEPERCKVEWRLPFADHDPALHRLHATIGGRPVDEDGFCRVEIITPRTFRAEDVEPGCGDSRSKGVAVTSVHVQPK
ncbi:MAG: hypothetical protein DHS20C14_19670 [Phycisphaeraceae bacterium]|nr:MAG: hypothetical protein DHS20C14_19670 [Phycisphaeraceae bacterium]